MAPSKRRSLPKKRSPPEAEMSPSTKKSKAEVRRESLSKAKAWAADRKRKTDDDDDDVGVKKSKPGVAEDEGKPPAVSVRSSARRRGKSSVVAAALAEDVGATRSPVEAKRPRGRPRKTNTNTATASKATKETKAPTTRKSRRKASVEIKVEEPELEEEIKVKIASPKVVAFKTEEDTVVKQEEGQVEAERQEETTPETEAKDAGNEPTAAHGKSLIQHLLQLSPMFFHAIVIQWTLAFAFVMAFCFDWWLFEFGPDIEEDMTAQRSTCVTLGLWLVTIVGYAIVCGSSSRAGWILTGSSLTMASFSTKLITSVGTPVPSLPIYSVSGIDINVPDLLMILCLVGCAAALMLPLPEQSQVVASGGETEASDKKEYQASGPKSLIGQRVAVEKDEDTLFGTVKEFDSETREWLVHFDDPFHEEEELNRVQLGSAFKLYSKHLSDNLKAMWRAGEL